MASDASVNIYTTPAEIPPLGVTPNFTHSSHMHSIYTFTHVLCLSASTIAVTLRMFTKVYLMRRVRGEDCTVTFLLALLLRMLIAFRFSDTCTGKASRRSQSNPENFELKQLAVSHGCDRP